MCMSWIIINNATDGKNFAREYNPNRAYARNKDQTKRIISDQEEKEDIEEKWREENQNYISKNKIKRM